MKTSLMRVQTSTDLLSTVVPLPALQKMFVSLDLPWDLSESQQEFLVNFWWFSLPGSRAQKLFEKFGENSEQNSGARFGTKIHKFGELSFCFSDLNSGPTSSSPKWADSHLARGQISNLKFPSLLYCRSVCFFFSRNRSGTRLRFMGWFAGAL